MAGVDTLAASVRSARGSREGGLWVSSNTTLVPHGSRPARAAAPPALWLYHRV